MRPRTLSEYVGQEHILAPGKLLRRAIEADRIQSLIFFGPPGTGKTSLAQIIANQTKSRFERLSGVESNVADMRRVLATAA
ncbi:MAG: AAA family ATPase, partial [Verrucomicrobiota bacterium]|nr:AAA family ATPase [Verrucomicrobiota bacterium]